MCFKASQVRFLGLWYRIKKALSSIVGSFGNATKSYDNFRCFDENGVRPFLLRGTIENGFRYRVAAPSIRIVPWAALASCWPLPQQLLPVSAAGGGRHRCTLAMFSGNMI